LPRFALLTILAALALPATAGAAEPPVLVLGPHGARVDPDPVLRAAPRDPSPPPAARAARAATSAGALDRALARLRPRLPVGTYPAAARELHAARAAARRLTGTPGYELRSVLADLDGLAARGRLTPSRVPEVILTVRRNREWWTRGTALIPGQRVRFTGSWIVWQMYAGHGLALQVLGSWGAVNGYWQGGARYRSEFNSLVHELVPLAASRAGGIAWEYLFPFGGGLPPWASGMAQATAVQGLARAARRLHEPRLLAVARRALPLFRTRPPEGVRIPTSRGAHYLLYSFAPSLRVFNGFAQAVIGLEDLAALGGGKQAAALATAGEREARAFLPRADTGAWSLYEAGGLASESTLDYHVLLRDFLRGLCSRTRHAGYCAEADRFTRYLAEPPRLGGVTSRAPARRRGLLRFTVSKVSRVGLEVRRHGVAVFGTSAVVGRGAHAYPWTAPGRGDFTLVLFARDVAGNAVRVETPLAVR